MVRSLADRTFQPRREDGTARELRHIPVVEKFLPAWPTPAYFMRFTLLGTLQYVLFSLLVSVTGFILFWLDRDRHGNRISDELSILSLLLMASQGVAVYS